MNQKKTIQLPPPACHFDALLSPTPRGARLARVLAVDWLRTRGLPYRVTESAEQIVAELAANAATHGRVSGRDFCLALLADADALRIEVTDTRRDGLPRLRPPTPDANSGRGLLLVEALADRWGSGSVPSPGRPYGSNSTCRAPELRESFAHRSPSGGTPVAGTIPGLKTPERKNPTKPHPSRPGRTLTRLSEKHQLG